MTNLRNRRAGRNRITVQEQLWRTKEKAAKAHADRRRRARKTPILLEAARTRRLVSLLLRLGGNAPEVRALAEMATGKAPRQDYFIVSLCAAMIVTRRFRAGLTWEEIKAVMDNHGRGGSREVQRYLHLAGRALRLINRLVTAGCVQRGETRGGKPNAGE